MTVWYPVERLYCLSKTASGPLKCPRVQSTGSVNICPCEDWSLVLSGSWNAIPFVYKSRHIGRISIKPFPHAGASNAPCGQPWHRASPFWQHGHPIARWRGVQDTNGVIAFPNKGSLNRDAMSQKLSHFFRIIAYQKQVLLINRHRYIF